MPSSQAAAAGGEARILTIEVETDSAQGDGRTRRRVRNREKVVQALYELIGEGHRRPTADQVAERAGVGRRTVFRHFDDLESLFAELATQVREQAREQLGGHPVSGPLAKRIRDLVARRAALFEGLAPFRRANAVHIWRSPVLQKFDTENLLELRADTRRSLAELDNAPAALAAGVDLLTAPEAWDHLRDNQGLSAESAEQAVGDLVLALLERSA
ncbi:MAG: TetR family transcriptional regulator [Deltaproteobacteria bacterium]